jgi:hypothetical protein
MEKNTRPYLKKKKPKKKKPKSKRSGGVAEVVEHLLRRAEALSSNPQY